MEAAERLVLDALLAYSDAGTNAWQADDFGPIAAYFRFPVTMVPREGGPLTIDRAEHLAALFRQGYEARAREGFAAEQLIRSNVTLLSPAAATVESAWDVMREGGQVYEVLEAAYVLVRDEGRWKITTLIQKSLTPAGDHYPT